MFPRRFASSTGPIGIDFGTTGVRLIQLRENGGDLSVVGAARLAESTEAFDALTVDDAAQLIRRATQGMSGRRCLVALPRCDLHSQSVRLPTMNDAELRQAVTWEAAQRFSLTKDQMECDFIRTGAVLQSQEGREEIIVVAAPHDAIMPRLEPILAAGLRPGGDRTVVHRDGALLQSPLSARERSFDRARDHRDRCVGFRCHDPAR